ncbi:nucleotidyl transferase AbiEii/AbiGii toxin family protein [Sulfurimonas sp. NWX79]|uniref:nucleotidyl transferase AbiEii/AbiGii toxin family protein n=1 Tax=Sulfurimonas sp. NWX79 TaxID=2925412 RepID=UPI003204AAD8
MPKTHPAIIKMLEKYDLSTSQSTYEALREILQEIVLLGLYRAGFFEHAVFYGGTALRILHGLDRFSEDLDFSLIESDLNFELSHYEDIVIETLHSFGFEVSIQIKQKENDVKSAFIKGDTMQHLLNIQAPQNIIDYFGRGKLVKIKIEVDTNPPLQFQSEKITLLSPSPFMVNTMTLPSLFAGKMHALLCRNWINRPKGRDWYDFVWYITQGYSLDLKHLNARLQQNCPWQAKENISIKPDLTQDDIKAYLTQRIDTLDITAAKRDIEGFISDHRVLDIWSREFFRSLIPNIQWT